MLPAIHRHGMDSAYITRLLSAMQGCDRTGCVVPVVDILIVFQCYSSVSQPVCRNEIKTALVQHILCSDICRMATHLKNLGVGEFECDQGTVGENGKSQGKYVFACDFVLCIM